MIVIGYLMFRYISKNLSVTNTSINSRMANIEKVIGGMKNISFINVDIVAYVRQAIISVIARLS